MVLIASQMASNERVPLGFPETLVSDAGARHAIATAAQAAFGGDWAEILPS